LGTIKTSQLFIFPHTEGMYIDRLELVILMVALVGAVWDMRTRTIPNWLTMSAVLGVFFFNFLFPNPEYTINFITLILASLLLWIPFFIKFLGGGDIKMLMVMAIASSIPDFLVILFCVAIVGGVQAMLTGLYYTLKKHPHPFKIPIPYGVAICIGYGVYAIFWV